MTHATRIFSLRFVAVTTLVVLLTACATSSPKSAQADPAGFKTWVAGYEKRAIAAGYNPTTVHAVMKDVSYKPRIIELDRKQPEGQMTLRQYIERIITKDRVEKGQDAADDNEDDLNIIAQRYGVPANVIVALWGKETTYGAFTGGFQIADALATLAYEGRRRDMFEKELNAFIGIVEKLQRKPGELKGSWAGAMGQCQFMPTSYLRYATDGDGDGKADIWDSRPDVFASTANFLKQSGWRTGEPIAHPIILPQSVPVALIGRDKQARPLSQWMGYGVQILSDMPIDASTPARLYRPDGPGGPAYVIYPNFDVLMKWNASGYFVIGVASLADQISQSY